MIDNIQFIKDWMQYQGPIFAAVGAFLVICAYDFRSGAKR